MKIDNFSQSLLDILACPATLAPLRRDGDDLVGPEGVRYPGGDFRVTYLSTPDRAWLSGQGHYERFNDEWQRLDESVFAEGDAGVAPIYARFPLNGRVLDVGGGFGTAAHQAGVDPRNFVSIDPMICAWSSLPADSAFVKHYGALAEVPRIPAVAEDLPFFNGTFDTVHIRSCIDHVVNPHRALLEARRVMKPDGQLVIGLALEGAYKLSASSLKNRLKRRVKASVIGDVYEHFFDKHMFHPTEASLQALVEGAGFTIQDTMWQPGYHNVMYLKAVKRKA